MNPGLVIKLRPAGPWRIGPDSGARNKVDVIYHSDSLYSAVTSAMARLGGIEEWLDATARAAAPKVCFSSCFPFLDEIGFVVPPRTLWPPIAPSLMSAAVRWKSARFVPLAVVQAMLRGQVLDKDQWAVDGASACLIPAGSPGPFRSSVRWSAAVDRLSGASERHGMACLEFRAGAGLWTVASFLDQAARDRWIEPVKAAFRWLADSGFGGERSRGWGRAESPEFIEGLLPELIVGTGGQAPEAAEAEPVLEAEFVESVLEPLVTNDVSLPEPPPEPPPPDPEPLPEPVPPIPPVEPPAPEPSPVPPIPEPAPAMSAEPEARLESETPTTSVEPEDEPHSETPAPDPWPPAPSSIAGPEPQPVSEAPAPGPYPLAPGYWLLSLFAPAAADTVDWTRGNYVVLARGGRVESPSGSGELKKQVRMVAEGSVLYAGGAPCGAAADVAPDGFAHPVFRAGFALAIPLQEVR